MYDNRLPNLADFFSSVLKTVGQLAASIFTERSDEIMQRDLPPDINPSHQEQAPPDSPVISIFTDVEWDKKGGAVDQGRTEHSGLISNSALM